MKIGADENPYSLLTKYFNKDEIEYLFFIEGPDDDSPQTVASETTLAAELMSKFSSKITQNKVKINDRILEISKEVFQELLAGINENPDLSKEHLDFISKDDNLFRLLKARCSRDPNILEIKKAGLDFIDAQPKMVQAAFLYHYMVLKGNDKKLAAKLASKFLETKVLFNKQKTSRLDSAVKESQDSHQSFETNFPKIFDDYLKHSAEFKEQLNQLRKNANQAIESHDREMLNEFLDIKDTNQGDPSSSLQASLKSPPPLLMSAAHQKKSESPVVNNNNVVNDNNDVKKPSSRG